MNYSNYFENKVASELSNSFSVITVDQLPNHQKIIKNISLVDSYLDVIDLMDKLDSYNVLLSGKEIQLVSYNV